MTALVTVRVVVEVTRAGGVIGAVIGGVRIGINGDTSVVRKGDASRYSQLAA